MNDFSFTFGGTVSGNFRKQICNCNWLASQCLCIHLSALSILPISRIMTNGCTRTAKFAIRDTVLY